MVRRFVRTNKCFSSLFTLFHVLPDRPRGGPTTVSCGPRSDLDGRTVPSTRSSAVGPRPSHSLFHLGSSTGDGDTGCRWESRPSPTFVLGPPTLLGAMSYSRALHRERPSPGSARSVRCRGGRRGVPTRTEPFHCSLRLIRLVKVVRSGVGV